MSAPLHTVRLEHPADAVGWRRAARSLLVDGVAPEAVVWVGAAGTSDLFGADAPDLPDASGGDSIADRLASTSLGEPADGSRAAPRVPRAFLPLAERVLGHRDPGRMALLYRVLWRLNHGEPGLLEQGSDPDVYRLHRLERAVSREIHKLHAFLRFRRVPDVEPETYVAWIEPEHHTLRLAGGFFCRRFATMRFSILTPEESLHWDTREPVYGPGGGHSSLPDDAVEDLWRTYYANIFNPARLRTDAMRAEMPVKFWKNLPEASLIAPLVREAEARTDVMIDRVPRPPPRYAARASASARRPYDKE